MGVVIDLIFVVCLAYHHSVRGCESPAEGTMSEYLCYARSDHLPHECQTSLQSLVS